MQLLFRISHNVIAELLAKKIRMELFSSI